MWLACISMGLASCLTSIVIYLTVTTDKSLLSTSYKAILLSIAIYTYCIDAILHTIGDVRISWPCLYLKGTLLSYFGLDSNLVISIILVVLAWNAIPYAIALTYRHQMLQLPNTRFHFRKSSIVIFFVLLAVVYCSVGASFHLEQMTLERTAAVLAEMPSDFIVEAGNRSMCCQDGVGGYLAAFGSCMAFNVFFLVTITSHIQVVLRKHIEMSAESKKLYWKSTQALIVQAVSPLVFVLVPATIIAIIYIKEFDSKVLLDNCLDMIRAHSVSYSLTVLATTAPFRKRLLRFRQIRKHRIKNINTIEVS